MNHRLMAFCLGVLTFSAILSSCGKVLEQADALVTVDGKAAGVVLKYNSRIDDKSVSLDTYSVEGEVVGHLFVSDSNPYRKDQGTDGKGGRYVILFLKDQSSLSGDNAPGSVDITNVIPFVSVKVRQVEPIKTVDGKTIKPWRKAAVTVDRCQVQGGLLR